MTTAFQVGDYVGTPIYTGSGSLDERGGHNVGYAYGVVTRIDAKGFLIRWEGNRRARRYSHTYAISKLHAADSILEAQRALAR